LGELRDKQCYVAIIVSVRTLYCLLWVRKEMRFVLRRTSLLRQREGEDVLEDIDDRLKRWNRTKSVTT
jgi:hypothetical protein